MNDAALFRFSADMLALWGVCANAKCRRARTCRGDAHDCVARHAPLVPEDAREGMKAMIEGKHEGLSFDGVQDRVYEEIEALLRWRQAVAHANGTRAPAQR